jgi:hypothetical protein
LNQCRSEGDNQPPRTLPSEGSKGSHEAKDYVDMTTVQAPLSGVDHFDIDAYTGYPPYTYGSSVHYSRNLRDRPSFADDSYESTTSSAPSSPQLTHSSLSRGSTPASSVSFGTRETIKEDQDDMIFPTYDQYIPEPQPESSGPTESSPAEVLNEPTELPHKVSDDHAIQPEPTRHVDYLSHDWREEDIWASWRYVVHRRNDINNSRRLENASWRSWMKSKNSLKTVSPESLNWLKDCDVTWLYGPLQTGPTNLATATPPPSRLSRSPSYISKKPILKKKSASAVILERTRSQHSLLQRAGEIIRVQQSSPALNGRPPFRRHTSEFSLATYTGSSVVNTPAETDASAFTGTRASFAFPEPVTPADCKHVNFNDEVRQVQAVESDEDEKPPADESAFDTDEDDDGGLVMAPSRSRNSRNVTPRGSFSDGSKTIIPLPSTTLKYRTDTPEPPQVEQRGLWPRGRTLSPSPSQETLRPPRPNHNFLIDDDPEVSDEPWQSSRDMSPSYQDEPGPSLRRTESGMFMPYDENDENNAITNGVMGSALHAIYTVKDIAHVIWNVGWHRDKTK